MVGLYFWGKRTQILRVKLSWCAHVEAEEGDLLPDADALLHHVCYLLLLIQPCHKGLLEQLRS